MTKFKNQKGFATIEIVFAVMIIALLSSVSLPKLARIFEVAQLNYETKRFVSEFYFAKSLSRSVKFEPEIFYGVTSGGKPISFSVASRSYVLKSSGDVFGEKISLPKKFSIVRENLSTDLQFENGKVKPAKSGTYTFSSPHGFSQKIKLDSVGRLHIEPNKNI